MKSFLIFPVLFSTILFAQSQEMGQDIFNKNCAECHATVLGITNNDGYENTYITPAPYIADLVAKLKAKTASKKEFTRFIQEYIQNPDKRKSLYGKRAIKKFGLMPSLKGALNNDQIIKLADFIYTYKEDSKRKKLKVKIAVKKKTKGEKLFNKNCAECHAKVLGITNNGGYENRYITPAPYITDLVAKLKVKTASKKEFTRFIQEYIQNPDKRKSLYGKRAIKKFGLMPSLKGVLNNQDIEELSTYLYDYK